jgi:hypothetical protein
MLFAQTLVPSLLNVQRCMRAKGRVAMVILPDKKSTVVCLR